MLWTLLYRTLTHLLLWGTVLCLPVLRHFKPKFAKWVALRYWPIPLNFQPRLWVHAVSVGEVNVAEALLSHLGDPQDILVTTTTQSGFKILHKKHGRKRVRYLPWDMPLCYRRLFEGFEVPDLLIVETEIWPELFRFVGENGARLVIINGRLSSKTLRLRKNGLLRGTLRRVTRVLARGEKDANRFTAFGLPDEKVRVVGNIKFDFKPRQLPEGNLRTWLGRNAPLLIMASISTDEVPLLTPQLKRLMAKHDDLHVLWAPRHLKDLDEHLAALGEMMPVCRGQLEQQDPKLLVLDTFGELAACYEYGDLSLVGGSFNQRGGQNFLESLQAGTPVILGPSTENFRDEVSEALAERAIRVVKDADEVADTIEGLLGDRLNLEEMSGNASRFLAAHGGAIERTRLELVNLGIVSDQPIGD